MEANESNATEILLVDDSKSVRQILKGILKARGFRNIIEAEDGKIASEILKTHMNINCVISDWNMPEMTGIELLQWVRRSRDPRIKNMYFVMITLESNKESILLAMKMGVNDYIVKPFNAETLKEKLNQIMMLKGG